MGMQEIQSLLNTIMLIVSPSSKDLGEGNSETPSWHPQRYPHASNQACTPSMREGRVKDDEKHSSVSVRWILGGQWSTAAD